MATVVFPGPGDAYDVAALGIAAYRSAPLDVTDRLAEQLIKQKFVDAADRSDEATVDAVLAWFSELTLLVHELDALALVSEWLALAVDVVPPTALLTGSLGRWDGERIGVDNNEVTRLACSDDSTAEWRAIIWRTAGRDAIDDVARRTIRDAEGNNGINIDCNLDVDHGHVSVHSEASDGPVEHDGSVYGEEAGGRLPARTAAGVDGDESVEAEDPRPDNGVLLWDERLRGRSLCSSTEAKRHHSQRNCYWPAAYGVSSHGSPPPGRGSAAATCLRPTLGAVNARTQPDPPPARHRLLGDLPAQHDAYASPCNPRRHGVPSMSPTLSDDDDA